MFRAAHRSSSGASSAPMMSGVPLETCSINFGIINSITKLHLVGISAESISVLNSFSLTCNPLSLIPNCNLKCFLSL